MKYQIYSIPATPELVKGVFPNATQWDGLKKEAKEIIFIGVNEKDLNDPSTLTLPASIEMTIYIVAFKAPMTPKEAVQAASLYKMSDTHFRLADSISVEGDPETFKQDLKKVLNNAA